MKIKSIYFIFLILIVFTSCSAQEPKEIFKRHENEFKNIAILLIDNRNEMLQKSTCGVNENKTISFTAASFDKCFGKIEENIKSKLKNFMDKEYVSHAYVKLDQIKFQIAVEGEVLLTNFYYAVYTLKDQVSIKTSEKDNIEKMEPNWYLVKHVQDTF